MEEREAQTIAQAHFDNRAHRSKPQAFEPKAILIAAQPGAGKTVLGNATTQELKEQGGSMRVDADRLRESIPGYSAAVASGTAKGSEETQGDARQLVQAFRSICMVQRRNLVEEGAFPNPEGTRKFVENLRRNEYQVEMRALAVPLEESQLGIYQRREAQRAMGIAQPRFVNDTYHRESAGGVLATVKHMEEYVDRMTVHNRRGEVLYDSEDSRGQTAAQAMAEGRAMTSEKRLEVAAGWDAVRAAAIEHKASPQEQVAIGRHQARAHFSMQADPEAAASFARSADQATQERSQWLAGAHGAVLASTIRTLPMQEGVAMFPELKGAYAVMVNESKRATAAGFDQEQRRTQCKAAMTTIVEHLKSGRPIPDPQLQQQQRQQQQPAKTPESVAERIGGGLER